jgi:hypothetical protein
MSVQEADAGSNWVQRAGSATYILVCAIFGVIGAFVGFMLMGLVAVATSASDGSTALLALLGGLLGLCGPIYALSRKRRTSRSPATMPSDRIDPPLHAPEPTSTANAEQTSPKQPATDGYGWFYTDDGKRIGPVPTERIQALLTEGVIGRTTQVWRKGLADWQSLSNTELAQQLPDDQPPPLSSTHIGNGYAWALAFAPIWASVLHYTGCYLYLSAKYGLFFPVQLEQLVVKTWQIPFGINVLLAVLDEQALKAAGWDGSKKLNVWLTALVPVYLYKRDQLAGAGVTRFLIWMACFFLSLLPIWF